MDQNVWIKETTRMEPTLTNQDLKTLRNTNLSILVLLYKVTFGRSLRLI